jgi:LysM repeat protein
LFPLSEITTRENKGQLDTSMRRAVLLILGLCFLTSITRPGFSEKPLRLFFEKNIDVEDVVAEEHTVQQGEWLFKILQDKGYSGTQIQRIMPGIQALNPHIPDLGRIKPGQVIRIPEGVPAAPPQQPRPVADIPADSYEKKAYVVQGGDTLVEILQRQGVPTNLIFGKYMDLFLELNPSVPDTNTLRAGQKIILPLVKGEAAPATATAEAPQPQREEKVLEEQAVPEMPVTLVPVPVSPGARVAASPKATDATGPGLPDVPPERHPGDSPLLPLRRLRFPRHCSRRPPHGEKPGPERGNQCHRARRHPHAPDGPAVRQGRAAGDAFQLHARRREHVPPVRLGRLAACQALRDASGRNAVG